MSIEHDLPMEEYLKHPNYSKSDLSNAKRSTQYVRDMRLNPFDATAAQAMGSAVHMLLLEPEKAEDGIITIDAGIRRGKLYDAALEDFPNSIIVLRKEWDDIEPMVESAKQHGFSKNVLGKGPAEVSFFTDISVQGIPLPVKCRPDLLPGFLAGGMMVIDIKTARDVTPEGFGKAAYNYHYHWSAWLTTKVLEIETGKPHHYYFMAIENHYPHETVIYQAMPWDYDLAAHELEPIMARLAAAHSTGEFKEIEPKGVMHLELPQWAFNRRR